MCRNLARNDAPTTSGVMKLGDFLFFGEGDVQDSNFGDGVFNEVVTSPLAGITYSVLSGGMCEELYQVGDLERLYRITQLGIRQPPFPRNQVPNNQGKYERLSKYSRLLHSFDVAAVVSLICKKLGFSEQFMKACQASGLLHDWGSVPLGEATALVDPIGFCEERNFPLLLNTEDFACVAKKYGLNSNELHRAILSEGLCGEIVDIADKLAYTARDIDTCMPYLEIGAREHGCEGLQTLLELLKKYPHICDIWNCIEISEKGQIYFSDSDRLIAFLKARTLMFREVYFNASSKLGEFMATHMFAKKLHESGLLPLDELLQMTDEDLLKRFDEEFGVGCLFNLCQFNPVQVEGFSTLEEAELFVGELESAGKTGVFLSEDRVGIKTGVEKFFVKTRQGVVSIQESGLEGAKELIHLAGEGRTFNIYYLNDEIPTPKSLQTTS